jgi:TonB family protein
MKKLLVATALSLSAFMSITICAQTSRQTAPNTRYAVSGLSIDQARNQLRQLEKQLDEQVKALPPLRPKDISETTAEYEKRKAEYERQSAPLLSAVRANIGQVKSTFYRLAGENPVFKTYNADNQTLTAAVLNKSFDAIVEPGIAKEMRQDWSSVQVAVSYFEADFQPGTIVLLWKEFQFGGRPEGTTDERVFSAGGVTTEPVPISMTQPEYNDAARAAGINGTVVLAVIINSDGTVKVESVRRSLGYGLDEKAIEAVSKWRFIPGKKDGKAVATRVEVLVNFTLGRK